MKKNRTMNLPLTYEIEESTFDSERFLKMRIKVMHSGLNLNDSYFKSDVIEKAKNSLANIPILAFVKKEDGTSNEDFAGHEFEIKITEDGTKYVYLGRPIGIIPETNNYETKTSEEGLEFVYVDAYIWKQYANSALDIITRDGIKKVSMEILVKDYSWEESYIEILDYSYTGIAMLGENVREAMIGAKAEVITYSKNAISDMLFELKNALEGGQGMLDKDKKNQTTEFEGENQAEEEENTEQDNFEGTENTDGAENTENNESGEFENNEEPEENSNEENSEDFENENSEEADTNNEEFSKEELLSKIQKLQENIDTLQKENTSLQETINTYTKKEKENKINKLFSNFPDLESNEEAKELKTKAFEMELDDIELRLFALRGKYTTLNNDSSSKDDNDNEEEYLPSIFNYSNNNTDEPIWASLVEQTKK